MLRLLSYIFKVVPYLIWKYPLFLYYSIKKDKLSQVKKYNETQKIIQKVFKKLKVEVVVNGKNNIQEASSYMLSPNHQSFLDALSIISQVSGPMAFLAKKESKAYPIIGRVITGLNSEYLDRDNLRSEIKTMQRIKKSMMSENRKWCIFSEGTRTRNKDYSINEFKAGAFKPAQTSKINIYPVAIWGTYRVLSTKTKGFKKLPIYISILPPLTPEMYKDLTTTEIANKCQALVNEEINRLRQVDQENLKLYLK